MEFKFKQIAICLLFSLFYKKVRELKYGIKMQF